MTLPRLLLVEDDLPLATSVTALLEESYTVVHAADGLAALDLVRFGGPFDVILLDLFLPKMDGFAFQATMKTMGVTTPIVITTGSDRAMPYGTYLAKPYDAYELERALVAALAKKSS